MKKLLGILGTITMAGSGMAGLVGNAPAPTKNNLETELKQENTLKILKRVKRWTKSWDEINQNWGNVELNYQNAAINFQRTQNHAAFAQAQQQFLQAQQKYSADTVRWQQEFVEWANNIPQERNQQWWSGNVNTPQKEIAKEQWETQKFGELKTKLSPDYQSQEAIKPITENVEVSNGSQKWIRRIKKGIEIASPLAEMAAETAVGPKVVDAAKKIFNVASPKINKVIDWANKKLKVNW